MLPGESDAAVHLDAGRCDEDEGIRAIGLCQRKIGDSGGRMLGE